MAAFWRFASSLARRPTTEEHATSVDPLSHRPAAQVTRRRARGRNSTDARRRANRRFAEDQGAKTPQAVPEDLEDEEELEIYHAVVREVAMLREADAKHEQVIERAEVDELCAEANRLVYHLDEMYGWEPGEPSIADRMFNGNIRGLISKAHVEGYASVKLLAVVRAMRAVRNGPNAGTHAIAKACAARNLVGGPSIQEAKLLRLQRMLGWDRFAEMVGMIDRLDRSQERAIAKRLQIVEPLTQDDVANERIKNETKSQRRQLEGRGIFR